MKIYNYDNNGLYVCQSIAPSSPREPGKYLIPANSTPSPNPEFGTNQMAQFINGSWKVVPDFRGSEYWLSDGTHHLITTVGVALPNNALLEQPSPVEEKFEPPAETEALPPPEPPTLEETKFYLVGVVQDMLDEKARERHYDSILAACSYSTSKTPKFAAEGQACVEWRDAVWLTCYELFELVMTGKMQIPTPEELLAMLPKMDWLS